MKRDDTTLEVTFFTGWSIAQAHSSTAIVKACDLRGKTSSMYRSIRSPRVFLHDMGVIAY